MSTRTGTATRTARRWRSGPWRSPRFMLGLALVLAATAAGGWVVAGLADDELYWSVRDGVRAGEPVREEQLVATRARLEGAVQDAVVPADATIEPGTVWAHDMPAGVIVPEGAWVGDVVGDHEVPLAVREGAMPADLAPGDRVDVWVGPGPQEGMAAATSAQRVLADVRVVGVDPAPTGGAATVVVGVGEEPPSATTVASVGAGHVTLVRRS
ncbi:hypothetical protein EHW97_14180 [Aeromicrobium camelliae]|uniref:SAF domain-containing protein n=1 Tax=Aeromicrobium camelliae TaxID=1538144 RepID=A0A3N6W405_9ACTN|nr:hypothetical protein [Aeromicrobium camelliae]RQN02200.1 hypothetical protein EHW97_14180 [Aeromicrobium camelliae]